MNAFGADPSNARGRRIHQVLGRPGCAVAVVAIALLLFAPGAAASSRTLLKDINTGMGGSNADWYTKLPNGIVFFATAPGTGRELFKTDGTRSGTGLLRNIDPLAANGVPDASEMVRLGTTALFAATDGQHGIELWRTDGTTNGTKMVRNIAPGAADSSPHDFVVSGSRAYFVITTTGGDQLWATNGTAPGTVRLDPFASFTSFPTEIDEITRFSGGIAFEGNDGEHGREPWISDPNHGGTHMIGDINGSAFVGSSPYGFTPVNGQLYFGANDGMHGDQLWKYDPTTNTLTMLELEVGVPADPNGFISIGSTLYFSGTDSKGAELWRADGSTLKRVKDIASGAASSNPGDFGKVNGELYFSANDGSHGVELWKSDGTGPHTTLVLDAYPHVGSSYPSYLTNVAGLLLYEARDPTHGYSLWRSDGTATGTRMVKDLAPGGPNSNFGFNGQAVIANHFFVLGDDGVHGTELWESDGTLKGTFVIDIRSGPSSSNVETAVPIGKTLYVTANDGSHGEEPWLVHP